MSSLVYIEKIGKYMYTIPLNFNHISAIVYDVSVKKYIFINFIQSKYNRRFYFLFYFIFLEKKCSVKYIYYFNSIIIFIHV